MNNPADIYVGDGQQYDHAQSEFLHTISESDSGIFIVTGGPRTGKNHFIKQIVDSCGWEKGTGMRPDFNILDDDPHLYLEDWITEFENGRRVFAIGEVAIQYEQSLRWLRDFDEQICRNGDRAKLFFNILMERRPAWQNVQNRQITEAKIRSFFDKPHITFLETDPNQIISGLWQVKREWKEMYFNGIAERFGFKTHSDEWWTKVVEQQTFEGFSAGLNELMGRSSGLSPEIEPQIK